MNDDNEPTVMTRQTFTVQSNEGPIRVTRIHFHSKNLNAGGNRQATPLDLMRLMDERISSIFEEIISQRIGLRIIFNELNNANNNQNNEKEEEEKEDKNNENKKNDNEQNKDENKDYIDDKEFELDENNKEEKTDKNIEKDKELNKTEVNKIEENKNEENKNEENKNGKNKVIKNKKEKKEKNGNNKKKTIGKLKVNPDILKPKKRNNKLSQKEIIFSRVCKYIFYSIILFTIYILVRKLLELLEIIDPEIQPEMTSVKMENNKNEKSKIKDIEAEKKENEIILNKKKEENKLN